jgi:hypothetical protein
VTPGTSSGPGSAATPLVVGVNVRDTELVEAVGLYEREATDRRLRRLDAETSDVPAGDVRDGPRRVVRQGHEQVVASRESVGQETDDSGVELRATVRRELCPASRGRKRIEVCGDRGMDLRRRRPLARNPRQQQRAKEEGIAAGPPPDLVDHLGRGQLGAHHSDRLRDAGQRERLDRLTRSATRVEPTGR